MLGVLLPSLDLPANARRTFRFHVAYALLDAAAGGIVLNAPVVALRAIGGQNWQLPIREGFSGIGMLAALYLGSWMAPRHKMPFVFIPGTLAAFTALGMVAARNNALLFLVLFGIGAMLEIVTRPAIAAILRQNYPVSQRGLATGTVRRWSSLSFLAANFFSAYLLGLAGDDPKRIRVMAAGQIICAGLLSLAGFMCFRQIKVQEEPIKLRTDLRPEVVSSIADAVGVVLRDGRFRRCLTGCFLDGFFSMLYFPLVWAFFSKTLGFGVLWCVVLMHSLPAAVAFVTTGPLGRLFDRTNPWLSWAGVRFATGVDAILLSITPAAAVLWPPLAIILPISGRLLRGGAQGGWWILWWQIGVTHFAPPGEDTSRYMGILTFLNGAAKLLASLAAMLLTSTMISMQPVTLMWLGGLGMIASGAYSLWQAARERKEHRPTTFAEFEAGFAGGAQQTAGIDRTTDTSSPQPSGRP